MSEWKLEAWASDKELEQMGKDVPVRLYADHDVSERLIKRLVGFGFSVKVAPKRGYSNEEDQNHIKAANEMQRCLIAQDRDYLTNPEYRKQINYGLIIVKADSWGDQETVDAVADNCESMLNWGKEFFKRKAIFIISPNLINVEYLTKTGEVFTKQFKTENSRLFSRESN